MNFEIGQKLYAISARDKNVRLFAKKFTMVDADGVEWFRYAPSNWEVTYREDIITGMAVYHSLGYIPDADRSELETRLYLNTTSEWISESIVDKYNEYPHFETIWFSSKVKARDMKITLEQKYGINR